MRRWVRFLLPLAALLAVAWPSARARADVSLQARFERNAVPPGESIKLRVTIDGAATGVGEPQITLPDGIEVLGSSRSQSYQYVNGRSTAQTLFKIELGSDRAGSFRIGPIRVRVGSQWYESGVLALTVSAEHPSVGSIVGRGGPADIIVDVTPREPYVGQPVILRVRLVQRAALGEDPQYTPPSTPGFWSERSSQPTSYYADQAGQRVLVTETRTRIYPLASGRSTIGEARAQLSLASPMGGTPFGGVGQRAVEVRSAPVDVHVRSLPPGAPADYDGAVGRFTLSWLGDRVETAKDVPITVWLDVRGVGNLPLLHTPVFSNPQAEVFSSTVQDSFGPSGVLSGGCRRFQWTVLPHQVGPLELDAPPLVWLDETTGRYQSVSPPPIQVQVTPSIGGHDRDAAGFPLVFVEHPPRGGGHPPRAWGFAIAGAALGFALRRFREIRARSRQAEAPPPPWVEGLRHARGASFWAAAGRACDELSDLGVDVSTWKGAIDAARFGGKMGDEERMRGQLLRRVEAMTTETRKTGPLEWAMVGGGVVVGVTVALLSLGSGGADSTAQRGIQADAAARRGEIDQAVQTWKRMWAEGAQSPGLAARLSWAALRRGDIAPASAWVLRGERGEPRDPALVWTAGLVRDTGGLEGYSRARLPVRALEWGLLALIAALLGVAALERRAMMMLLGVALVLALAPTLDAWRAAARHRAVVVSPVTLIGQGVDLSPGQVVRVLGVEGGRTRVEAGPSVTGEVPTSVLLADGTS